MGRERRPIWTHNDNADFISSSRWPRWLCSGEFWGAKMCNCNKMLDPQEHTPIEWKKKKAVTGADVTDAALPQESLLRSAWLPRSLASDLWPRKEFRVMFELLNVDNCRNHVEELQVECNVWAIGLPSSHVFKQWFLNFNSGLPLGFHCSRAHRASARVGKGKVPIVMKWKRQWK